MLSRRTLFAVLLTATALASAVQAQVKLTRKLPEGKRTQVTTTHTDQKLTIGGQEVPTLADATTTEIYTYAKPATDGTVKVDVKSEAMSYSIKAMGASIAEYNSAKPDEAKAAVPELQAILDGFKAVHGKTYTLVFEKDGKLKAVEGVDALLAGLAPAAKTALEAGYSKEAQEKEVKKDLERIPNRELKKGDKWQATEVSNIGAGQTLTYEMFYEYQGTIEKDGRTIDKISIYAANVKYAQAADPNAVLKIINSDLKVESSTGALYFDREKGEVVEISTSVRITGPMTFSVNNMEIPGKLDLVMESQTIVK